MLKEKIIEDKDDWNSIIKQFPNNDIYFLKDYFIPFQRNGEGRPVLYFFESSYGKVAYPFMINDIAENKNFKNIIPRNKYFDIRSAYAYGGPLYEIKNKCIKNLQNQFIKRFENFCNKNNIISQFDRFHPLINNHIFFKDFCNISQIRKTVYMDIKNKDRIWENINSKCRNKIRKAKKNGINVVLDEKGNTVENFKNIYNSTMDRHNASDYYYFNEFFFNDAINYLKNRVIIANAYYRNKIIASSLILRFNKYLHYHFSGVLEGYMKLAAVNLLIYEVAKWGSENGYEIFHLGGGYESGNDFLYKFKKSFSKLEDKDFYIGKKIYKYNEYKYLASFVNYNKQNSFFPAYRIDQLK
jgi:lipid II:glycine glycyltransferase (peptidoglycan interpeptide bridge formation enzyme)